MIEKLIFYFFAAALIFSAIRVISAKNPVHAALFLISAFFSSAALWMLLQAEFLSIVLVLVYVGAVMVLFLFVVMMLDIHFERLRAEFVKYLPVGVIVGVLIILEITLVIVNSALTNNKLQHKASHAEGYSNTKELGRLLYTEYLFAFELAAIVLLVAIVAAIALSGRNKSDALRQNVSAQINTKAEDRLRIIDLREKNKS